MCQNHFENQRVGTGGEAVAMPNFDARRIAFMSDNRQEHWLLVLERLEVAQLTVICLMLSAIAQLSEKS